MAGKVEIFGRDDIGQCGAAVEFCKRQRLPFVYLDLAEDRYVDDLTRRLGKPPTSFPQIFIGGHKIGSLDDLKRALPVVQQIIFGA